MIPLENFRFANPWLLTLIIFIPLLGILTRLAYFHKPATLRYADIRPVKRSAVSWRVRLMGIPTLLRWLAMALIIVALARPQTGNSQQIVRGDGIDIVVALDISGSMQLLDFMPAADLEKAAINVNSVLLRDRLVVAKEVLSEFIDQREFDRVGLVVFAQEAFAQSPLTVDHVVLQRLLKEVDLAQRMGLNDGTAIGMGIATAANMLKESSSKSRIIIVLTDGDNTHGQIDPITAAQAAKALDIKVYTIAVGKEGPVPAPASIFQNRLITQYTESNLDESVLKEISTMTNARFFRAQDADALRQIYEAINELEKSTVQIETFHRYNELSVWLLIPALLILLYEMALRNTVFRRLP